MYRIGGLEFDAQSGDLRRGSERRRLEPRAAKTLELLCRADGAVVPHDRLIAEVWGGRSLSENSVSVVISQLRRTLGDDARNPFLIETVPKRGYRLIRNGDRTAGAPPVRRNRTRWPLVLAAGAILALLGLGVVLLRGGAMAAPTVGVEDVLNHTGSLDYDPLARATSELIVTQLDRRGFRVRRGSGDADLQFSSRLVLWNGRPSLGMTLTDQRGVVRWSGMTNGTAEQLPRGVAAELDELRREIPPE